MSLPTSSPQPSPQPSEALSSERLGGGRGAFTGVVAHEWRAHRSLWFGVLLLALAAAVGLALVSGDEPLWAAVLANAACAATLLAFAALFAMTLVWRHVRGLAMALPESERDKFLVEARNAMLRFALPLGILIILCEAVLTQLPRWIA